ncbi:MAG TPA: nucleoside 2-deoxyribosyltransferase [Solirubrobacteraceae bacterium]|nr:nucleoside 2-deoxyribosyltransferase [Solirubrobacteraceae bacterium]
MATVYVASPFGFSAATRGFYEAELLDAIRARGLEPLDPWADPHAGEEIDAALALPVSEARNEALRAINRRLGAANAADIQRADAVLAVLDGVDVDSGTAAEIGFAAALGKPIVGLRLDTRQTGDNEGAVVNLQVEHFILAGRGRIVRSAREAIDLLSLLAGGRGEA